MVPVQEALAFAGVQQRPVAPPLKPAKPDAPKAGGPNNITAREVSGGPPHRTCLFAHEVVAKLVHLCSAL